MGAIVASALSCTWLLDNNYTLVSIFEIFAVVSALGAVLMLFVRGADDRVRGGVGTRRA